MSAKVVSEQIARLDGISRVRALSEGESKQLQKLISTERRYDYMRRANEATRRVIAMSRCYVCDAPGAADADPRNATCDYCRPARQHVVSMQTRGADWVAVCPCGWEFHRPGADQAERDRAVRGHWRAIIAEVASA